MDFKLRTHYWDDHDALAAFKLFILNIHGLDFSEWDARGYWDYAYTPFTFFDGNRVIASICVYLLDTVLNGENTRIAQISGVGTLPEWRNKGLSRQLTDKGLHWARRKHDGVFLFSTTGAIPFYKKCGFSPSNEFVETTVVDPTPNCAGAIKLDPGSKQDLDRIYEYAKARVPISDKFSVLNAKLIMFHVLYKLRDCVFEIPDLDCLIFCERTNSTLNIYDIVGKRVPCLDEFYPYLADANDRIIEFHFNTDKLGLSNRRIKLLTGNNLFVGGDFPIARPVFPFTSRA